ncbi:MAG: hypothetical protein KBS97_01140 [Firmicutes bacterium]|nr:hypothetical protein [Candidatus Fiminaster equi]
MNKVINRLISISFIGYVLILLVERILALILSVNNGGAYALVSNNVMPTIYYAIVCLSITAGAVLLAVPMYKMAVQLFKKKNYEFNYKELLLGMMILLFSGMMHTGWTLAPLQFVAYGFLIGSMVCVTVDSCLRNKNNYNSIFSVVFLTLFSMAIPVAYMSVNEATQVPFYTFTLLAVFAEIPLFGFMLFEFFNKGEISFNYAPVIAMVALSGSVVLLNFTSVSDFNWFVAIFVVLTTICFLVFEIRKFLKTKKSNA